MPNIKFYYAPGACSLVPHILLREAALPFDLHPMQEENTYVFFSEGFARINPKMQVPVLVHDHETITEIPAIVAVIADLAPHLHFLGKTALENARVWEWLSWLSTALHVGGWKHLFRPQQWTEDASAFDGIKAKSVKHIKDMFNAIESKLSGLYAVGDGLTAVEPYLFVFYRWANLSLTVDMRKDFPKYTALVENLVQKRSVQDTLVAEGISSTLSSES